MDRESLVKSFDTKEIGKSILEAAQNKAKQQFTEKITDYVHDIMKTIAAKRRSIEQSKERQVTLENEIEFNYRKLQSIEDGQFTIDQYGNLSFNDTNLNEEFPS